MYHWAYTANKTDACHWESSLLNEVCQCALEEVSVLAR